MYHKTRGTLKYVCILPDYIYQSNKLKGNMPQKNPKSVKSTFFVPRNG